MTAYCDTQVVVWLCESGGARLTPAACEAIEESDVHISPMVLIELEYLFEIGRVLRPPLALLEQLEAQIGLRVCGFSSAAIARTALHETWTRDPFDRVIVAHARASGFAPLITPTRRSGRTTRTRCGRAWL